MSDETTTCAGLVLKFTGEMVVTESQIEQLLRRVIPNITSLKQAERVPVAAHAEVFAPAKPDPMKDRLVFTVKETARMLGVTDKTVYRLVQRQLLKSSRALRHLKIPRSEIERFLKTTTD